MEIKPFLVEEWMNQYEVGARYNIAETCVDSVSLDELFQLTGEDKEAFLSSLCARRLTYGDIFGQPAFLEGICRLYRDLRPEQVTPTHGAAGANHHLFCSLVEPGDKVISVLPTYQQLYSIPDSLGAQVELLPLSPDNGFLPDLARLEELAQEGVKLHLPEQPQQPHRGPHVPGDAGGDRLHRPPPRVLYPVRRGVPPSHPGGRLLPLHRGPV